MARKTNAELAAEVENLAAELAEAKAHHRMDIEAIAEKFNAEADSRGWCSDYQAVVTDLNESLSIPLDVAPTQWEAHTEIEVTLRLSNSITVEAVTYDEVTTTLVQESIDNGTHGFGNLAQMVADHITAGDIYGFQVKAVVVNDVNGT